MILGGLGGKSILNTEIIEMEKSERKFLKYVGARPLLFEK
jgi:hypothetical protein